MDQYLIDTNTVSDYFSASLPAKSLLFLDSIIDAVPKISVITQIELLCWKTTSDIEQKVTSFIADSTILNITPSVIAHCAVIRRNKKVKTPDAIIAATALAFDLHIITNNEKDFAGIENLKVINPFKMA